MKSKRLVLAILMAILTIAACNKDPKPNNTSGIKNLFAQTREPSQLFTVNSNTTQTITGQKGTRLTFYPNSFVTRTGAAVTGNVQIELKEIYSVGDMILSKYTTTSNGSLLSSGGELLVKATQNGQELVMQTQYRVRMPAPNPVNNMLVFYGGIVIDSLSGDSILNWTPVDTATISSDSTLTGGGYIYNFYCDSLTFINCDYFYNNGQPLTAITITCSDTFNQNNCQVFVAIPSINGVTNAYDWDVDGTFSTAGGYEIPIGMNVTIVAIAEVNGQYYSALLPTTVTQNGTYSITLTPTTLQAFETAVSQL